MSRFVDVDSFKEWLLENSINEREVEESKQIGIWIDAFYSMQNEQSDCEDCIKHGGDWECDRVHCHKGDAISRQAAIEVLKDEWAGVPVYYLRGDDVFEYSKFRIESLPSVQPKERCIATITLSEEDLERIVKKQVEEIKELLPQKGHWVGIDDEPFEDWECDRCGYTVFANDVTPIEYNFCPNCGCRMEEGDSE